MRKTFAKMPFLCSWNIGKRTRARQLAGIVAETAAKVNAFSVEETGAPVVNTPADLAALISVVLAETDEVLTWELINKHTAKG